MLKHWLIESFLLVKYKQGVQGLQAFALCEVTVNGEHT